MGFCEDTTEGRTKKVKYSIYCSLSFEVSEPDVQTMCKFCVVCARDHVSTLILYSELSLVHIAHRFVSIHWIVNRAALWRTPVTKQNSGIDTSSQYRSLLAWWCSPERLVPHILTVCLWVPYQRGLFFTPPPFCRLFPHHPFSPPPSQDMFDSLSNVYGSLEEEDWKPPMQAQTLHIVFTQWNPYTRTPLN